MPAKLATLLIVGLLAGCGSDEPPPAPPTNLSDAGVPIVATPTPLPNATGPGTALGLTRLQLEDADLVDTAGERIGEVERVDTDPAGGIVALVIELKTIGVAGRLVRIGLDGLSVVPDGDDWNLRTATPREQLAANPAVTR